MRRELILPIVAPQQLRSNYGRIVKMDPFKDSCDRTWNQWNLARLLYYLLRQYHWYIIAMPPFSKHFYDFLLNLFGKLGYCHSVELVLELPIWQWRFSQVLQENSFGLTNANFCVTDLEFRIINGMCKKKRLTSQLEIYSKEKKTIKCNFRVSVLDLVGCAYLVGFCSINLSPTLHCSVKGKVSLVEITFSWWLLNGNE